MGLNLGIESLMGNVFGDKFKKTKISDSLQGKTFIIAGSNGTGKTLNASKFPNPIFLTIENGLASIANVGALPVNSWSDLLSYSRKFGKKEFKELLDQGEEITIVIDGAEGMTQLVTDYVLGNNGVTKIKDIPFGAGYKEIENEVEKFAKGITNLGFCLLLIFHEVDKDGKYVLKGDWRITDAFKNRADIICHLEPNGVDENNKVIPSSAYMYECEDFFARNRFADYMPSYLEEFSASNLINAYREGMRLKAKTEGCELVSFRKANEVYESEEVDFDTVKQQLAEYLGEIEEGSPEEEKVFDKIDDLFGTDFQLRDATKKHLQGLIELRNFIEDEILNK